MPTASFLSPASHRTQHGTHQSIARAANNMTSNITIDTNPVVTGEVLYGRLSITIAHSIMPAAVMTCGQQLLALEFIDGDSDNDITPTYDNWLRRFSLRKEQCRAMTAPETKHWQAQLQSWQRGDATPNLRLIGTAFQQRVWRALFAVGYGQTISYFDLAKKIDSHHRAVAKNGVGRNPICYFVPCHRVVAKNGGIGGYGGGLNIKIKLLQAEQS